MDKIEQLYKLYLEQGLITSATTIEMFSNADDNARTQLYELGKENDLFTETDSNTFKSAWSVEPAKTEDVVKVTADAASGNQAVDTDLESEVTSSESQSTDPVTEDQALFNYKQRTGKDAGSVMDLTDEDYKANAFLEGFKPVDQVEVFSKNRSRIIQLEKERKDLEAKEARRSSKIMSGVDSAAHVDNALKLFDKERSIEIGRMEANPSFKLYNDAITQLEKDTGNNQATGDPLKDLGSEFSILNTFKGKSFYKNREANEVIDINQDVEKAVISKLSTRDLQKLAGGFFTLQEKENLINEVKIPIIKQKAKEIQLGVESSFNETKQKVSKLNELRSSIQESINSFDKDNLSEQQKLEYNDLVKEFNNVTEDVKTAVSEFNSYRDKSSLETQSLEGEYGIDLSTGVLNDNFKLTSDVNSFREKYAGDGFWNGTADILGGDLIQGSYQLFKKATVGSGAWLWSNIVGDTFTDQDSYSSFDAFSDVVDSWTNKTLVASSTSDKFSITKEEGGFKDFNLRNYLKLGTQMVPFTGYLINEVKKGNFTGIRSAVGNSYMRLGSKGKVLAPASQKLKDNIIMADAAFRATILDNQKQGERSGLNGFQANTYATALSMTEGLVQTIMPDAQFLKGVEGKAIKDAFVGSLKNVATKQGAKAASKEFFTNLTKEFLEEEINAGVGLVLDMSYGLALPKGSEFLNSQIELLAGTLMLSSSTGSFGAAKTYSNQKTLIYNQIHNNISSLDLQLKTMAEKSNDPEVIEQIKAARKFALDVSKAIDSSPENVTSDQIELLIEKQKLIEKKKSIDPAFHTSINESISKIDSEIESSPVKIAIAKKFDKDVTNVGKSLNSIGQKVDETIIFEEDLNGDANSKMKQFLLENPPSDVKAKGPKAIEKYAEENKNAYGSFTTTAEGKEVLIINKQSALNDSFVTTGQHEFLHKVLRASLASNPKIVTEAGALLLQEIDSMTEEGSELKARISQYGSPVVKDGKTVYNLARGVNEQQFYEEILPLFSEALTRKDVKINKSSLQKIGDLLRQVLQNVGIKNVKFNTADDVKNFITDYNKAFSKGKLKGALKDFAKGDVKAIAKPTKPGTSFSKADEDLKIKESIKRKGKEISALVPEGTTKKQYDRRIVGDVYQKLIATDYLDKTIKNQFRKNNIIVEDGKVYDVDIDTVIEDIKQRLLEGTILRFNPEANKDFGGFLMSELVNYRIGDVTNKLKLKKGTKRIDAEAGTVGSISEIADDSMSIEDQIDLNNAKEESYTELTKATEILSKEQYDRVFKEVEAAVPNIKKEDLSYKQVKEFGVEIVSEISGVPVEKILNTNKNMSKGQTTSGANFIEENINYIRKTLPKGAVQEAANDDLMGTATNLPNKVLKKLYNKNPRITTDSGLSPYTLKPGLKNQDILDAIGRFKRDDDKKIQINPRSPEAVAIQGLLSIVERNISNELVRTVESDLTPNQKQDVAAGKSDTMFSKSLAKVLVESAANHLGIKSKRGKGKIVKIVGDLLTTESYKGEEDFNEYLNNLNKDQQQVVNLVFGGRDWLFGMFSDTEAVRNNGVRYEKIIKEAIKNVGIKGVSVDLSEGGFGSGVDLVLTVNGKNINIELKLNRNAQMGSFSINVDGDSFSYTKSVDGLIEKLPDLHKVIQNSLKNKDHLKSVEDYNNRGVELGGSYDKKTGVLYGPESMFLQLVKEGKLKATNLNIKQDSKGKRLDIGIINLIYNNKGVFNIDIGGKGLYYLGTNKDNLPTSKLEGDSSLMIRRTYNQIGKTGLYRSIVRAFAKLDSNITESNINFSNLSNTEQDIKTITNSFSKSLNLDKEFNDIIENKTGIESYKNYMSVKAQVVGASKGKFDFFIAPSAEDFVGLLYKTLGKGEVGDAQMAWYKENLLDPYARAMEKVSRDRNFMARSFLEIKKQLKIVPKNLKKKIPGEPFTQEQAIRVYIWNKKGSKIPGISKNDSIYLTNFVENNEKLKNFADQILSLSGSEDYADAGDSWVTGTITTDLLETLNTTKRRKYLELWQQNVDEIFSEKNLNKLEAAFGADYKEAIKNILKRMKTGRNRAFGGDSLTGRFVDWMTSATGAIMFFNTRSAVLQTLSAVNFINFGDNNIFAATKAFANQKQYWSDFKMLFNSEFLVERRDGLKINVNEADIADIAKEKGVRGIINKLLKLGFTPTQLADSFAIATGGATFYRNRLKSLIKDGMDPVAAEKQAMRDFRETAEESQQSSRPDKISSQQAGPLGRTILAFANTPAQYARIIKKAASDIKNGRGDFKTNISKIMYYGVAQNLVFNALQQALFAALFDEEEELIDDKTLGIANGMADSLLRGIGISGAIISVLKNVAVRGVKESKKSNPKFENAAFELIKISPPVSSKINKIRAAARSYDWDKKEMKEGGLSIDNPAFLAAGNVVSATTNIPLDRVIKKIQHLKTASDSEIETYKRIFLLAGWSEWELGIKKPKKKTPVFESKKWGNESNRGKGRSTNAKRTLRK